MSRIRNWWTRRKREKEEALWDSLIQKKSIAALITRFTIDRVGEGDRMGWWISRKHRWRVAEVTAPFVKHLIDMLLNSYRNRYVAASDSLERLFWEWRRKHPVKDAKTRILGIYDWRKKGVDKR